MTNEVILRFTCAILIIIALFLLFIWRVAAEDAAHYKALNESNAKAIEACTEAVNKLGALIQTVINTMNKEIWL